MTIREIPLSPIPHQLVATVVNGQTVQIEIRQNGSSLYTSCAVDGVQITQGVRAVNHGELLPWADYRVNSQIEWVDTQGDADPQHEGLGSRWLLCFDEV